jgi:copper chaperone NosL
MRELRRLRLHGFVLALCALLAACEPADGPTPIAFDREPCAHCRMLISDQAFAAQLQLDGEDPLSFDDPGCLLRYRAERQPHSRAAWYHHLREARWIPESEVAFVRVPLSPMGYGIGAVDRGTPDSFALEDAEQYVRSPRGEGADAPR